MTVLVMSHEKKQVSADIPNNTNLLGACRDNKQNEFTEKILAHNRAVTSFSIVSNGF
jgi:hypothetical protein